MELSLNNLAKPRYEAAIAPPYSPGRVEKHGQIGLPDDRFPVVCARYVLQARCRRHGIAAGVSGGG